MRLARNASLVCVIFAMAGCMSSPSGWKYERQSFAEGMGLDGCSISVPLTPSEVIENSKRSGNPDPESNDEWIAMAAEFRAGDQLRWINCLGVKGKSNAYYALIRDGSTILKFYPMIFD